MIKVDVVLFNDCGSEIARETITEERDYIDIIRDWIIYAGDRIEFQEIFHED